MRAYTQSKESTPAPAKRAAGADLKRSPSPIPVSRVDRAMLRRQPATPCPCDGGCPRCAPALRAKLTISQPQDRYEQEADRVADRVMRMPEPEIRRKPT